MKTKGPRTLLLGELIAAAFDEAARESTDPREVARLATLTVVRLVRRSREVTVARQTAVLLEETGT